MNGYIVINNDGRALEWSENPWGDGACLIDGDTATFFKSELDAKKSLSVTLEYAKQLNGGVSLNTLWQTKKWKVVSAKLAVTA